MARAGFDGILDADGFKARMRMLADRTARLARGFDVRRERRVGRAVAAPMPASPHLRPVAVKVLYHDRGRGALPNTTRALANYLAKQGPVFDRHRMGLEPADLARAWAGDRRVFHVIVSPNDGHRMDDMVGYARELVAAWERRTGPLEWAASVETKPDMAHPQGNRHVHVMIRGVQDGHDLYLDPRLVSEDLRRDAMEVATDRLGWMSERELRDYHRQLERMRDLRADRDTPARDARVAHEDIGRRR